MHNNNNNDIFYDNMFISTYYSTVYNVILTNIKTKWLNDQYNESSSEKLNTRGLRIWKIIIKLTKIATFDYRIKNAVKLVKVCLGVSKEKKLILIFTY